MGVFQKGINNLLAEAGVVATVLSRDIKAKKQAEIKPKNDEEIKTEEKADSNVQPQTEASTPSVDNNGISMEMANANTQKVINQQFHQKRNYKKREDSIVKRAREKAQEKLINSKFEKEMKPDVF